MYNQVTCVQVKMLILFVGDYFVYYFIYVYQCSVHNIYSNVCSIVERLSMEETEHHKKNTNLIFDLFFKKSISPKIFHNNKARYFSRFSVRTSGTPSPCCRGGRPVWSSASGRCSGSGRRGYTSPRPPCTPRWWRSPGRKKKSKL